MASGRKKSVNKKTHQIFISSTIHKKLVQHLATLKENLGLDYDEDVICNFAVWLYLELSDVVSPAVFFETIKYFLQLREIYKESD